MKTNLLLLLVTCISNISIAQTIASSYLFTNASLENSTNNVSFTQTGTALTFSNGIEDIANNGIKLNGDVLNNPAWTYNSGTNDNDNSIAFWIKTSDNTATEKEVINHFTTYGWRFTLLNGSLKLYGKFFTSGTTASNQPATHTFTTANIADGNWHFVVLTLDKYAVPILGTSSERSKVRYKLYLDNTLVNNVEIQKVNVGNHYAIPNAQLFLGDNKDKNGVRYVDEIDNVRYYNGLLNTTDIATLFNELSSTLHVDDFELNTTISVFPNPTSGIIQIKSNLPIKAAQLLSMEGKQLLSVTNTSKIDISQLQSGIYFLHINTEKGVISKKITKI